VCNVGEYVASEYVVGEYAVSKFAWSGTTMEVLWKYFGSMEVVRKWSGSTLEVLWKYGSSLNQFTKICILWGGFIVNTITLYYGIQKMNSHNYKGISFFVGIFKRVCFYKK